MSLARRSQWLRGHDLRGKVLWERPIPWEGWALVRLDVWGSSSPRPTAAPWLATAPDFPQQRAPTGDSNDVFGVDPAGTPLRISRRGVHLICAALDGRVRWRAVVDQPLGPLAAGSPGAAVLLSANRSPGSKTSRPAAS